MKQTTVPPTDDKSLKQLVELYNSLVAKPKRIKRFSDRQTALRRITEQFAKEKPAYLPTPPSDEQIQAFQKKYKVKKEAGSNKLSTNIVLSEPKKEIHFDLKVTKGLSEGGAEVLRPSLLGRKARWTGMYLYRMEGYKDKNPRRAGSHGWFTWNHYEDGMTYEAALAKRCRIRDINDDVAAGRIKFYKNKH